MKLKALFAVSVYIQWDYDKKKLRKAKIKFVDTKIHSHALILFPHIEENPTYVFGLKNKINWLKITL